MTMESVMSSDLQAWVSGLIVGAMMKVAEDEGFLFDIEQHFDGDGNYLPMLTITGRVTGQKVLVRVDTLEGQ